MTIQEAIKSGRPFKRPHYENWLVIDELNNKIWFSINKGRGRFLPSFSAEDLLADDWKIKEKWYEGNFKKKYPNGVLCWCYNENIINGVVDIIINYDEKSNFPFISPRLSYSQVSPFRPEKAPACIKIDDEEYPE